MKDLPVTLPPGISLAAVPKRGDVRDCLISRCGAKTLDELPQQSSVGTSSPRRAAQLLAVRNDLQIEPIRGNVPTRVSRVLDHPTGSEMGPDATVLAVAGLVRLGRREQTEAKLPIELMLPAAGQAALALHCRADDHVSLTRCLPLNHAATATAVNTERLVLEGLEASCGSPIAVLAEAAEPPAEPHRNADAHWYRLRVRISAMDGSQPLEVDERIKAQELRRSVKRIVEELKSRGAISMMHP